MKKILFFLSILLLASCTQNGGHIGKIFGRWHIDSIEADGCDAPPAALNLYWAFQTDVIQMQRENGHNNFSTIYGRYRIDDNTLFIDFPEASLPNASEGQPPFAETGLARQSALQILRFTSHELVLSYHPDPATDPSATITYHLRKI